MATVHTLKFAFVQHFSSLHPPVSEPALSEHVSLPFHFQSEESHLDPILHRRTRKYEQELYDARELLSQILEDFYLLVFQSTVSLRLWQMEGGKPRLLRRTFGVGRQL